MNLAWGRGQGRLIMSSDSRCGSSLLLFWPGDVIAKDHAVISALHVSTCGKSLEFFLKSFFFHRSVNAVICVFGFEHRD
jgi:hypothetical protein